MFLSQPIPFLAAQAAEPTWTTTTKRPENNSNAFFVADKTPINSNTP